MTPEKITELQALAATDRTAAAKALQEIRNPTDLTDLRLATVPGQPLGELLRHELAVREMLAIRSENALPRIGDSFDVAALREAYRREKAGPRRSLILKAIETRGKALKGLAALCATVLAAWPR
jgi:hypothetical protein